MSVPAVANGPIALTDTTGKHISVPLTALLFDATGKLDAQTWPPYNDYKDQLNPWLDVLAQTGVIVPGQAEAPKPAMLVEAVAVGLPGNHVMVEFSNITEVDPHDLSKTTFDAKITEKQEYKGLTPATVQTVVGTEIKRGTQPGLVTIPDADAPALPKEGDYPLAGGGANAKAKEDIPQAANPANKAFTAEARSAGVEGDNIKVTIDELDEDAQTFTLRTAYVQTIQGLKIGDLPAKLAGAAGQEFVIRVSPPQGGAFGVPSPGVVALTGGLEQQEATRASATIFTA